MTKTVMLEATTTEISSTEDQHYEFIKMMECLAPWKEKTNDEESIGSWETTMATRMMLKLLELWLTEESRERIEQMLEYYHPLDRARTYGPKKIKH